MDHFYTITYINDIAREVDIHSEINLFTNVAKIFSEFNDDLQLTLDYIYQSLNKIKFNLNHNKCQVLNIHKSKPNSIDLLI